MKQGNTLRLIMKEKNISVSEMARRMDVSRAAINNYSNTETFQEEVLEKILTALEVNKGHFLKYTTKTPLPTIDKDPNGRKIPFYDTEVFATISPAMGDVVALRPDTFIHIPMFSQGEFALQITGHSMRPYISHGDWVVVKRIINREAIIYDEPYMVVTKEDNLKTVKFIKEHRDKKRLWLVPYNIEQFNEQTILKEDILELYRVVGLFRTV